MLLLNMIVNAMFSRATLLVYVGCIVEGLACYRTMGPYNKALSSAIVARQLIVWFCSSNVLQPQMSRIESHLYRRPRLGMSSPIIVYPGTPFSRQNIVTQLLTMCRNTSRGSPTLDDAQVMVHEKGEGPNEDHARMVSHFSPGPKRSLAARSICVD